MKPQRIDALTPLAAEGQGSRIQAGDQHGQGGEYAGRLGLFWLTAQLCGAFVAMTTSNRPQTLRHKVAARAPAIDAETPNSRRQVTEVSKWTRKI